MSEKNTADTIAFYRALFQQSPIGMSIFDATGQCIEANDAIAHIIGATKEQVLAQNFHTIESWKANGLLDAAHEALATNAVIAKEMLLVSTFGKSIDANVHFSPFIVNDATCLLVTLNDLTLQKKLEDNLSAKMEELSQSEQRFALAMNASRDGVWDWDVQTNKVYYSPGYTEMIGYTRDEFPLLFQSWADLIHPADQEKVIQTNEACVRGVHDDFEIEYRMQKKDGQWLWVLGRGKAVARDEGGRATRMIGTHTNIAARKLAEARLKESEKKYRNISENPFVGIFRTSIEDGTFLYSNKKNAEIIGYASAHEIVGKVRSADFYSKKTRALLVRLLQEHGRIEDFEITLTLKNGTHKEVLLSAELWPEEHYLEGVIVDITARKHAEQLVHVERVFSETIIKSMPWLFYIFEKKYSHFCQA